MAVVRAPAGAQLGPYELGERLGAGGMAEVYVARRAGPRGFHKKFAIKRILPQLGRDPRFVAMFCDEARICAALAHPNIVQVVDFGEADGELFMALEFIDGVSVAKLLRSVAARGQRFPLGAGLFIIHEVLRALAFAHEAKDEQGRPLGVVHRDVSPGNILIGRAGEVKLTDFGIVRSSFIDRRTYPGELKGKLGYMSPEQVIGSEVDPRSDIFTVGIVLAEMLIARPLFPGRNEMEILTRIYDADLRVLERHGVDLPPDVLEMLKGALARDREERFQTARQFGDVLRACARNAQVALAEAELVAWLGSLGILPSRSGVREAASLDLMPLPVAARRKGPGVGRAAAPSFELASRRSVAPRESEAPPPSDSATPADAADPRAAGRPQTIAPRSREPARQSSPPRVELPTVPNGDKDVAIPVYHLRARSGELVGPLAPAALLELVATGRVDFDTLASENGDNFRPLRSMSVVIPLVGRPAFRFSDPLRLRAAWRRGIDRARLASVFYELVIGQATGLLVARAPRRHKRVYLEDGVPRFIASSERDELLGVRLVASGQLSESDIERALSSGALRGLRLGESLVQQGSLRPMALLRALGDQLEARFSELFSWTDGELYFVRGELCGEEVPRSSANPLFVLARAIRESYSEPELVELLSVVRDAPILRSKVKKLDPVRLGLGPEEATALERAPGSPSLMRLVNTLSSEGVARQSCTLRALFIGISAGVLTVPGWGPKA